MRGAPDAPLPLSPSWWKDAAPLRASVHTLALTRLGRDVRQGRAWLVPICPFSFCLSFPDYESISALLYPIFPNLKIPYLGDISSLKKLLN